MLSMIAAVANNNVIGKDNKLIWKLPADLKRFKDITSGKTIIMGRKTFESLGRVLPNRKHIVLTRNKEYKIDNEQVEVVYNINDLKPYIESKEECFVLGGEAIYSMLINKSNKMYITKINEEFDGDTYFPDIDEGIWKIVKIEKGIKNEENPYEYEYINYERKTEN